MKTEKPPNSFVLKLRTPAYIVYITLPLLCWALLAFRWCGLWLTQPWMTGVVVVYYAMAVVYLAFAFVVRMRVIDIIGLFLLLISSLFMWIPYHWVLAVFLVPALFMALYKRGYTAVAVVLTVLTSAIMLIVFAFAAFFYFSILEPEKNAYHMSPDGRYIVLEHAFDEHLGETDVLLCRAYGPLLVEERMLYLANCSDFGGGIQWIDEGTILIYGEEMDVFEDPAIDNYKFF